MTDTEIIKQYDPNEVLILVLRGTEVQILKDNGKFVEVKNGYTIEVESKGLYKLLHNNQVVAPFRMW